MPDLMHQTAPYPHELADLVSKVKYYPNWRLYLSDEDRGQGCKGLTFNILARVPNSVSEENEMMWVRHLFPVPAAAFNRDSWMNWMLERCFDVQRHEACEFFMIDGVRVFAPHHSEGEDPYIVWHLGDWETANKGSRDR